MALGRARVAAKAIALVVAGMLALGVPEAALAQPVPSITPESAAGVPPGRALFVGNSYLSYAGGVPTHIRAMAAADGTPAPELRMDAIGGSRLDEHDLDAGLAQGPFDLVVLQEHSSSARDAATDGRFRRAAQAFAGGLCRQDASAWDTPFRSASTCWPR